jgi:HAD superfamily hydrolase (TIGR01549 family)
MATTALTAVLYDLDGTLVDSRRDIAAAFQWALRHVTPEALPDEDAIASHIGKPLAVMAFDLGFRLSARHLAAFMDAYRRYYAIHCARHTQPYPGVVATLNQLSGLACGVVTTKSQAQAEIVLRQLKLTPYFRHIQGAQPGMRLKPAPDTVEATLAALGCRPEQALMVGDTPNDILAARAAYVKTCAVTYGFGAAAELQACEPDYCIDTFAALIAIVQGESIRR